MLLSVKKRYTLTIPKGIREKLRVKEGEYVEAEIKGHSLVLTPVKVIKRIRNTSGPGNGRRVKGRLTRI